MNLLATGGCYLLQNVFLLKKKIDHELNGLDSGSVLGHRLVTAARGGAHLRARVVSKKQTDRQTRDKVIPN